LVRPLGSTDLACLGSDLSNLAPEIHPLVNYTEYETARLEASPQNRSNILRLLFTKLLLWDFVLAGFLSIIVVGLSFFGPLVIERIMTFLNNPDATFEDQRNAYLSSAVWIGMFLLRVFLNAYCQRRLAFSAAKAEHVLIVELL